MSLRAGFEYGYAVRHNIEWCIRRADAARMLCGRRVSFVPLLAQPDDPQPVHGRCVLAYLGILRAPAVVLGECPACGDQVELAGGRIGEHGGCTGVNMAPRGYR